MTGQFGVPAAGPEAGRSGVFDSGPVTGQFGLPPLGPEATRPGVPPSGPASARPNVPPSGPEAGRPGVPPPGPEAARPAVPDDGPATGEYDIPANEFGRHGSRGSRRRGPGTGEFGRPVGPGTGEFGKPREAGEPGKRGVPVTGEFAMPDGSLPGSEGSLKPMPADQAFGAPVRGGGHAEPPGYGPVAAPRGHDQEFGGPSTGATQAAGPAQLAGPAQPAGPGGTGDRVGGSGRPSPSIFGTLTVFTLLDGTGEAFDRLAEETVEAVRRSEPDTLVYTCHSVKSAPLQRIVYELYRDQVAYTEHQRQPHMERFVTERQPMVLATNVIELTVNAAKVVPLPTAFTL